MKVSLKIFILVYSGIEEKIHNTWEGPISHSPWLIISDVLLSKLFAYKRKMCSHLPLSPTPELVIFPFISKSSSAKWRTEWNYCWAPKSPSNDNCQRGTDTGISQVYAHTHTHTKYHKHLTAHSIVIVCYNKYSGLEDVPHLHIAWFPALVKIKWQTNTCLVVLMAAERHKEMETDKKSWVERCIMYRTRNSPWMLW